MAESICYLNGEFVPLSQASLPLGDLGLVRGYGVFDYGCTYAGVPFRLRDHALRFEHSARAIRLDFPWRIEEVEALVHETLSRNPWADHAGYKLILTGGATPDGFTPAHKPSLAIIISPIKPYPAELVEAGSKLVSCEAVREFPTVKTLNYINAIIAMDRAREQGAVEALYRTPDGCVTECTRSNFFIFKDGQLITAHENVLAGVTRQVVLELAEDLGPIVYRNIRYAELVTAGEAFITSTTKEVMPVRQVDDIVIGAGVPGPYTRRLMELFRSYTRLAVAQSA